MSFEFKPLNRENATNLQPKPAPTPRPPFTGLQSRFIKRTVLATLVSLALVAMTAISYNHPAWGVIYLSSGLWALGYLGLTTLIIKSFLFDRNAPLGLILAVGKIILLGLMLVFCVQLSRSAIAGLVFKTALIAGITTPLAVVSLRAVGIALEERSGKRPEKIHSGFKGSGPGMESKS
jgi:hypothetical protein